MLAVLTSPVFLVVALGSALLAASAGAIGCISVIRGQSLIGDAIGNAAFPGVVLAFMLTLTRDPLILVLGAATSGLVGFYTVQILSSKSKLSLDSSLAIVLTSFFGLGMVLKSHITGNVDYMQASQAGLQNYIFGQASYMMEKDVLAIAVIGGLSLLIVILFFKELQLYTFDETLATTFGYKKPIMDALVLLATVFLIAVGLKVVGAILISAMLITPCVIAQQYTNNFKKLLIIAALSAAVSAFIGVWIATALDGIATGPAIIVVMSTIALVSIAINQKGRH